MQRTETNTTRTQSIMVGYSIHNLFL
jgi:hypothetical protein